MITLLIICLIQMSLPTHSQKELKQTDLMAMVGCDLRMQKLFTPEMLRSSTDEEKETYFPYLIDKSLNDPNQFTLFGITVDELHIKLHKDNRIVAVFITLDNQDLLKKMIKEIGSEYIASGVGIGEQPIAESNFIWDYYGGCVSLSLNANKFRFQPVIVRDNGLVIFNNCKPLSYISVPGNGNNE